MYSAEHGLELGLLVIFSLRLWFLIQNYTAEANTKTVG